VVLVGTDEDDRSLAGGDQRRQAVPLLEPLWNAEAERTHDLVDRAGGAGTAEEHDIVLRAPDGGVHDAARVVAQAHRLQASGQRLGVRVGVQRQDLVADEVLDEAQRPAGGGVVGVHDALGPERSRQDEVVPDHRTPDQLDERVALLGRGRQCSEWVQQLGRLVAGAACRPARLGGERLAGAVETLVRGDEVGDQRLEQPQRQRRVGLGQGRERFPVELEHDAVAQRRARRTAGATVDERDLPEHLARPEDPQPDAALVALDCDLHRSLGYHVQRVPRRPGGEDDLAIGKRPLGHPLEDALQVLVVEPCEEPAVAQQRQPAGVRGPPARQGGRAGRPRPAVVSDDAGDRAHPCAQVAREALEHLVRERAVEPPHDREVADVEHEARHLLERDGRPGVQGRARQCHLAEYRAGRAHRKRQHRLLAAAMDRQPAAGHEVHAVGRRALPEQDLVDCEAERAQEPRQLLALVVVEDLEEVAAGEQLYGRLVRHDQAVAVE